MIIPIPGSYALHKSCDDQNKGHNKNQSKNRTEYPAKHIEVVHVFLLCRCQCYSVMHCFPNLSKLQGTAPYKGADVGTALQIAQQNLRAGTAVAIRLVVLQFDSVVFAEHI